MNEEDHNIRNLKVKPLKFESYTFNVCFNQKNLPYFPE